MAAWVALFAAAAWLYRDVLASLARDWYENDNYTLSFLVVPVAFYFAWERRKRFLDAARRPNVLGLVLVVLSLAVLVAGVLGAEVFTTRVSFPAVIAGTLIFVYGWEHFRIMFFPLAFTILMIPIPAIIFNQIAFPLQLIASRFGEAVLTAARIPMLREGNLIHLANTSLEVAEACSGIHSLISLLMLGIVCGYFMESRIWARWVLALGTIPITVVANGLRVAGTGVISYYSGPEAAEGFFHTFSGWLVFVVAFSFLFVMHRVLLLFFPAPRGSSPA